MSNEGARRSHRSGGDSWNPCLGLNSAATKPSFPHELERMRQASYVPSFELAQIEMGLGNHGGALACLEHAVVHRESYVIFLKTWNTFGPLKREPRFQALLAQIGLA